jgi:D-beta-D-heptose 7-phosphate kinase/D-beta-D-heptose 1-phosphate adenosyltransferase
MHTILNAGIYKMKYSCGAYIVCGLNSDESVKKIKGNHRPILNQDERALFLANTGYIDYIYIYDEPTSEEFVRKFKPDVHINGASYGKDCIEAKVMEEYRKNPEDYFPYLHLIEHMDCPSSSEIIRRILERWK